MTAAPDYIVPTGEYITEWMHDEGINAAVRSLVDWLSLDFVAVVAVRADHAGEVQPLAGYHRYSPSEETPDPLRQSNLKHVLDGDEVVQLADAWRPWFHPCIERFGADRCMFESNFPVDRSCGSYAVLWNAFKRIAAGASAQEKAALFHDTAARVYRLAAHD